VSFDLTPFAICRLDLRILKLLFNPKEAITGIGVTESSLLLIFVFFGLETMLIIVLNSGRFLVGTAPLNNLLTYKK